jgi:deoxyribose-phosphate aldolase
MYVHERVREDFLAREAFLLDIHNAKRMAPLIDHTLLRADAGEDKFSELVRQASANNFRAVCLPSGRLEDAAKLFRELNSDSSPLLCTVIGFPLGHSLTNAKTSEIDAALVRGATELDYVQNIGWVKDKQWTKLCEEAKDIVGAAKGNVVKVILETALLTEEEIYLSGLAAARGGVHVLKTSTGFAARGAILEDLRIMSRVTQQIEQESGCILGLKASGGIKTYADAVQMIQAGATRLGTSAGVQLMTGEKSTESAY